MRLRTIYALALASGLACATRAQTPQPISGQPESQSPPQATALRDTGKPSATSNVDSSDVKTGHAIAAVADLPRLVPPGRPAIGLVLEGGGAQGLAHIGVIRWLEEHRIPVDRLTGTSMGSLVGGLYASGLSASELEHIATDRALTSIFSFSQKYTDVSFRRREDQADLPQAIQLGLRGGPSLRNAVIEDGGLNDLLRLTLNRYNRSHLNFNHLPIPFRCVATDLNTMQQVVFQGGPMPQAIRASISIPGVFAPVEYRGHYLVDGAIMDNLPTDIAKQDLHADIVIAVHLASPAFANSDVSSIVGVFARAYASGTAKNERAASELADVLITAETGGLSSIAYDKARELIAAGYTAADGQKAKLLAYALSDSDWKAYMSDRTSRILPEPARLEMVKVEGGTSGAQGELRRGLHDLMNQPIRATELNNALHGVQGNGEYRASFETFGFANADSLSMAEDSSGPQTGVLIKLGTVKNGPPFLLFGSDVTAANSNVTRTTFDFRVYDPNFGGYGSELRADVRVGFLTQLSTEYYRNLTPSGYFVKPRVSFVRQPVYLWENQARVSEHLQQQAGGELEFGRTFSRNLQASLQWNADVVRWHRVSGADGTSDVSGVAQTAMVHFVLDRAMSGLLSPEGYRVEASAGALFNSPHSEDAPIFRIAAGKSSNLARGILGASIEGNTYMRRNVAEPFRFTQGGPFRLSASSIDEYRGTDTIRVGTGYAYRIADLPTGIGQGLYLSLGYEGGEIWAPERRAILRQDGVLTGIAATPIGVIKFGGSLGDDGRRKVFFSFGKLF